MQQPFLKLNGTESIPASGSATVTLNIPGALWYGMRWGIKKIEITNQGSNVTVTDIQIDGHSIGEITTQDMETLFGGLIPASSTITASGDNAGASAEDLEITVWGAPIL